MNDNDKREIDERQNTTKPGILVLSPGEDILEKCTGSFFLFDVVGFSKKKNTNNEQTGVL